MSFLQIKYKILEISRRIKYATFKKKTLLGWGLQSWSEIYGNLENLAKFRNFRVWREC